MSRKSWVFGEEGRDHIGRKVCHRAYGPNPILSISSMPVSSTFFTTSREEMSFSS